MPSITMANKVEPALRFIARSACRHSEKKLLMRTSSFFYLWWSTAISKCAGYEWQPRGNQARRTDTTVFLELRLQSQKRVRFSEASTRTTQHGFLLPDQ